MVKIYWKIIVIFKYFIIISINKLIINKLLIEKPLNKHVKTLKKYIYHYLKLSRPNGRAIFNVLLIYCL